MYSDANSGGDTKSTNVKEHYETSRKKFWATVGVASTVCIAACAAAVTIHASSVIAASIVFVGIIGLIIGCFVGKKYYQEVKQYESQLPSSDLNCNNRFNKMEHSIVRTL